MRRFQDDAGLSVDGIAGPKTRAALHAELVAAGAGALPAPSLSDTLADALAQIRDTANRALAGA